MSNFSRKEFEAYQHMYHEIWDRNALRAGFIEDNPDIFDEVRDKAAADAKREMAKAMLADGVPVSRIAAYSGLSEEEIRAL